MAFAEQGVAMRSRVLRGGYLFFVGSHRWRVGVDLRAEVAERDERLGL